MQIKNLIHKFPFKVSSKAIFISPRDHYVSNDCVVDLLLKNWVDTF